MSGLLVLRAEAEVGCSRRRGGFYCFFPFSHQNCHSCVFSLKSKENFTFGPTLSNISPNVTLSSTSIGIFDFRSLAPHQQEQGGVSTLSYLPPNLILSSTSIGIFDFRSLPPPQQQQEGGVSGEDMMSALEEFRRRRGVKEKVIINVDGF